MIYERLQRKGIPKSSLCVLLEFYFKSSNVLINIIFFHERAAFLKY